MTERHWDKILRAIGTKMGFSNAYTRQALFAVLKENWDLLADERALDAFLKEEELAIIRDKRDKHQEAADTLDELIAAKEAEETEDEEPTPWRPR